MAPERGLTADSVPARSRSKGVYLDDSDATSGLVRPYAMRDLTADALAV
jgi:hypothetical protein